ncbi:hypothetical protein NDU88_011038 [Pleurodeles waltl]|uniref:Uncharacterized protein n=1 Tax=Pleurodeles waltl TaxID=8319 RepID=A0AAV7S2Y0_PLEWA|nr:hypothetical protein NDU88_011038 [Pleurodeles waltl]
MRNQPPPPAKCKRCVRALELLIQTKASLRVTKDGKVRCVSGCPRQWFFRLSSLGRTTKPGLRRQQDDVTRKTTNWKAHFPKVYPLFPDNHEDFPVTGGSLRLQFLPNGLPVDSRNASLRVKLK